MARLGTANIIKFIVIIIILAIAIWFCFYINAGHAFWGGQQTSANEPIVRAPIPTDSQLTEKEARTAISYLNGIRAQYGKELIGFDSRLYALATDRARDMIENSYFDHTNPKTGECADSIKAEYGIGMNAYVAENIYFGDTKQISVVIDAWLKSRGHRFNLLFNHAAGAIGCYKNMCVFLGLNYIGYGSGCIIAKESDAFWQTAEMQEGEV